MTTSDILYERERRFHAAVRAALAERAPTGQIGTLGEKLLHATLKHYAEPDPACHEQILGRHHADAVNGSRISEVQTANFNRLRPRLEAWLSDYTVDILYPVAAVKYLRWIDPDTGETGPARRSPKRGQPGDIAIELTRIRAWLGDERVRIRILLLELEEYRLRDGYSRDGKRGSHRYERIPLSLIDEVVLHAPGDYLQLLPPLEQETFTSADVARAARRSQSKASLILRLLRELGQLEVIGKNGNSLIHRHTQL
ncbi:MAG: hypothetical protein QM296_01930 [Bacillota bacterium]|nr:hypothetical protein [Bacillota bacterium]